MVVVRCISMASGKIFPIVGKGFVISIFLLLGWNMYGQAQDTLAASVAYGESSIRTGRFTISPLQTRLSVGPLGVGDAVKYIQTLPGISTGIGGSSSYYARGGNLGNNLMTLDGVPIYRSSHLLGLTLSVNPDMVSNTDFYLGGFESEDGNVTASHIKMKSRSGNMSDFDFSADISPFMIGTVVSAPIVKDKLSFIASARISPIGLEYKAVKPWVNAMQNIFRDLYITSYDVYAKLSYQINTNHSLDVSVFNSNDKFGYGFNPDINLSHWSNVVAIADYKCSVGAYKIRSIVSYNGNNSGQEQKRVVHGELNDLNLQNGLDELRLSLQAERQYGREMILKWGICEKLGYFTTDPSIARTSLTHLNAQAEWEKEKLKARIALRVNAFYNRDGGSSRTWLFYPDISTMVRFSIAKRYGVEFTLDGLNQFYHTLEGIPMGWSMDMIVPASNLIKPEQSLQAYGGFFSDFGQHHVRLGGYYKLMHNLVYFKDAKAVFSQSLGGWKNNVEMGNGTSYGAELLYEKHGKILSYKFAYTYSKTDRKFENLNRGVSFPAKFDRRNILNASLTYNFLNRRRTTAGFTSTFTFQSGHWETMQDGFVQGWTFDDKVVQMPMISSLNSIKMPDYIRWDNSLTITIKNNKAVHTISIGVYNTLNHHNTSFVYYDVDARQWRSVSLFPVLPTFSYRIEF